MRIDDSNRVSYNPVSQTPKRNEPAQQASQPTNLPPSEVSRNERLDKLKQMMSEGRPIDAGKLADKMLGSGIFFDERA